MEKTLRIFNQTRGFRMSRKQAEGAIEICACAWVELGVSVRDLTLSESIAARNSQAAVREPLPYAEERGLVFWLGEGKEAVVRAERGLARAANVFAWPPKATVC